MLFLVFDIELVLLLPVSVSLSLINIFGFTIAIIFFIILTIGFIFEIGSSAISITSNHNKIVNTNINNINVISSIKINKLPLSNNNEDYIL